MPREVSLRGRSLSAVHGILREFHGGGVGPNQEGAATDRTRLWLYSPSGELYDAIQEHRCSQESGSLGARVYAEDQTFTKRGEIRTFDRHASSISIGEERFEVVTVLYPQDSIYEPRFGFVQYIDYPGHLQSYPDYIQPEDVLAVSIQTVLEEPMSRGDFDGHVTKATDADRWVVGFRTTWCEPFPITAVLIGAGTLEGALEQYQAMT